MNKVLQSAGRVIRTDLDSGVIVLLDDRFLTPEYEKLFPREWDEVYPVTQKNFKNILLDFWQNLVQS
jgi:Rad3-related DNA helicase